MALVWEHFCGRVCRDPNFTVTWCADLERLWVCLTFQSNSEDLFAVVAELAVAWMLCGGLRAWLLPGRCWWLCFALWLHGGGSGLGLNDGLFVKL